MSIYADYESMTTFGDSFAGDPMTSSFKRSWPSPAIILPQRRRIRAVDQLSISLGVMVPSRLMSISSKTWVKSEDGFYLLNSCLREIYSLGKSKSRNLSDVGLHTMSS